MFILEHIKSGERLVNERDSCFIEHNGYSLLIGCDGKIYDISCGDGGLYYDDISNEYRIVYYVDSTILKKPNITI